MNARQGLLLASLLGAATLAYLGNRDGPADAELALPMPRGAAHSAPALSDAMPVRADAASGGRDAVELPILALLSRSANPAPARTGQPEVRLFAAQSWAPSPVVAAASAASAPPPAPTPPALPFRYLGRQIQGGLVQVFLAQGEEVQVVRLHGVLDNKYRVDSITPNAVIFNYLPMNLTQPLLIGASD